MQPIDGIRVDVAKMTELKARIPPGDFVDEQFDIDHGVDTTDVLLIFSAPRSGSTLLCELLRRNDVCLAHEYLQPYVYLPMLAQRWQCLHEGKVDPGTYIKNLGRFRTYPNGWIGINLQGSHLRTFALMEHCFAGLRLHFVHLVRRDLVAQAVSFAIASRTEQWSSHFEVHADPKYKYSEILQKLHQIQEEEAMIQALIVARDAPCRTVVFEDLVANSVETLRNLPCIGAKKTLVATDPGVRKQSNQRNIEWIRRFAADHFEGTDRFAMNPAGLAGRLWKRVVAIGGE